MKTLTVAVAGLGNVGREVVRLLRERRAELRERLERALDRPFLLSGSGSTLFALYPSTVEAGDAVTRLRTNEPTIVAEARLVTAVPLDA